MKEVILFTLKAQTVTLPEEAKSHRYYVSPGVCRNLPLRPRFPSWELEFTEPADQYTRWKLTNAHGELAFCCHPGIEALVAPKYKNEIKDLNRSLDRAREQINQLRSECDLFKSSHNIHHDRLRRWEQLPLWRRLWTVLTHRIPY